MSRIDVPFMKSSIAGIAIALAILAPVILVATTVFNSIAIPVGVIAGAIFFIAHLFDTDKETSPAKT